MHDAKQTIVSAGAGLLALALFHFGPFAGAAQAGDVSHPFNRAPDGALIGVGVICNTDKQARQFVSLRESGQEIERAVIAVNTMARDPHACGVAAIAFVRDATVGTQTVAGSLVQIVRINVIAGYNASGWHRVGGAVQYAIMEGQGEAI